MLRKGISMNTSVTRRNSMRFFYQVEENFYINLNMKFISESNYIYESKVWNDLNIKHLGEYHATFMFKVIHCY